MPKRFQIERNLYLLENTSSVVIRYKGKDKATGIKSALLLGKNSKPLRTRTGYFRVKDNLQEAVDRREEYIRFFDNPEAFREKRVETVRRSKTFEELFKECGDYCEKKANRGLRCPTYAKSRKNAFKKILPFFKKECPFLDSFQYKTWDKLVDWIESKPNRSTPRHVKEHLRYALNYAFKSGYIPHPFAGDRFECEAWQNKEGKEEKIVAIEDNEFYTLVAACEQGIKRVTVNRKLGGCVQIGETPRTTTYDLDIPYEGNPDLRFQLLLIHDCGNRPGRETLALEFSHFIEDPYLGKVIDLPPKLDKNKKGRKIPVTERIWTEVQKRRSRYGDKTKFLFPMRQFVKGQSKQVTDWNRHRRFNKDDFKRLVRRANLSRKVTPNYIRHKFISDMCSLIKADELSVSEVALMAGNSPQTIEKHYLHMHSESANRLRKVSESRYKKINLRVVQSAPGRN